MGVAKIGERLLEPPGLLEIKRSEIEQHGMHNATRQGGHGKTPGSGRVTRPDRGEYIFQGL
jgi:hypothetical protein